MSVELARPSGYLSGRLIRRVSIWIKRENKLMLDIRCDKHTCHQTGLLEALSLSPKIKAPSWFLSADWNSLLTLFLIQRARDLEFKKTPC